MEKIKKVTGFGIIEVVVSSAILIVALLGLTKMQGRSIVALQNSNNTATAALLSEDLLGRMRANIIDTKKGRSSMYIYNDTESAANIAYLTNVSAIADCYNTSCESYVMAAQDILDWQDSVTTYMPSGAQGKVCFDTDPEPTQGSPVWECDDVMTVDSGQLVYTIKVKWTGREGDEKIYYTQTSFEYQPWDSLNSLPSGLTRQMGSGAEDWSQLIYDAILGKQPTYPVNGSWAANGSDANVSFNASQICSSLSEIANTNPLDDDNRDWICQKPCEVEDNATINAIGLCACTGVTNPNAGVCDDFSNGAAANE